MRRSCILAIALLAACSQPPAEPTDTRESIATRYVGGSEMPVHARPDDKSPVVTTFQHSESVPVLATKGDWVQVRTAMGSGWAHQSDLVSAEEGAQSNDNPKPKFLHPPAAIISPTAHGTIYIEADVNTDGDVMGATILENTTGSEALAQQNASALQKAKFYPIVIRGARKPFKYDYRVDY